MRQGIAACRGIRDVCSGEAFFLIFDDAIICQSTQTYRHKSGERTHKGSGFSVPTPRVEGNFLLLKQAIKCGTRIAGCAGSDGFARRNAIAVPVAGAISVTGAHRGRPFRQDIAGDGDARREQLTRVGLVFQRDAYRYWFGALKARGRFKVYALLATMQRSVTLGAGSLEVYVVRQRHGAVKTARGDYILNKTRELWPRYI